ncbi:MAG: porphobilinogen synthase, partial [Planctomycetia bacterium]|nr:porphobilinogen synthase [Planctomycetia bacterium]
MIKDLELLYRPRRLRRNENIRSLVRETVLTVDDFIAPVFVITGKNIKNEISSMPGIYQYSVDRLREELDELLNVGVTRVILFGIPNKKDPTGSDSFSEEGIIQQAVRFIKEEYPQVYVISDVCLCEYTDHGHCGILTDNNVDNDATLEYLGKQVVSHAQAGVDMVAPSGMMDGMVAAIRHDLDDKDFYELPIMSYA